MTYAFQSKKQFKEVFTKKFQTIYQTSPEEASVAQRYHVLAHLLDEAFKTDFEKTNQDLMTNQLKRTIYFSMEFLMGRLITNNLQNSGYYNLVKEAFHEFGYDLNEVEHAEVDAGLGNGGLGRLSACFLDSAASLGLPLYGNSLRYKHGFFRQKFENNQQVEYPDTWLNTPFIWEEKDEENAIHLPLFGYVEHTQLKHPIWVKAVPYTVKIVGDQNGVVTHLRLWGTEPSDLQKHQDEGYLKMVSQIDDHLYPDDSTDQGKTLRLTQSYVFSAAGVQHAIREHRSLGRDLRHFHHYYAFQLNDTHPTLVIPEMMRILMDEEHLGYDEAWKITTQTCAFTNHTILSEALEKWDIHIFRTLLPRIYEIIQEMNRRFKRELEADGRFNNEQIYQMGLIGQHRVRMAHICLFGAFSVNGVAALHTEILKHQEMNDFYQLYPHKFNNKTNGVTHRRWLIHTNPELVQLLDDTIGIDWRKDLTKLKEFAQFKTDMKVQKRLEEVKLTRKRILAEQIKERENITIDVNSIFDIQVKRLHEYKRQLMNILHIIYVYQRLKTDTEFKANYVPHTFIFGAKAAPSYRMAKMIIELINDAAQTINHDEKTNHLLKVVFVENYNVTYAEYIMTAADLSEQISTASKEASGTGNMKFMMNGAITIGTMDGANVEIVQEAGSENNIIFGLSSEEVVALYRHNHYKPNDIYENDQRLKDVFKFIRKLKDNPGHYDFIMHNLLNTDYFLVLKDFASYVEAHEKANLLYQDRNKWLEMMFMNIAHSGFFTSDRTIQDYNTDIWQLRPFTWLHT